MQYIQWLQQDKLNLIQSSINTTETSDALPSNEERWKVSCYLIHTLIMRRDSLTPH